MLRTSGNLIFGDETQSDKHARYRVTPHSFRHYCITRVRRRFGGSLKLAQQPTCLKDITVTQRYARVEGQGLDERYCDMFAVW